MREVSEFDTTPHSGAQGARVELHEINDHLLLEVGLVTA